MASASSNGELTQGGNVLVRDPPAWILKLPDKMILKIMRLVAERSDDAVRLMLVCSRFRSIASSPTLWADFELVIELSPGEISAIVRRSQGLPLKARIWLNYEGWEGLEDEKVPPSDAEELLQHSALFKEIRVGVARHSNDLWTRFHLEFPMPRLELLATTFVPEPMAANNIITHCHLQVENWPISYPKLLDFLDSVPLLHSLVIGAVRGADYSNLETSPQSDRIVTLRNLEQMELEVYVSCAAFFVALLDQLVTDNLETLRLFFVKPETDAHLQNSHITGISDAITRYRLVQLLSFAFLDRAEPIREDPNFFEDGMTVDDFEALMLGRVPDSINTFHCLYASFRNSYIEWERHPGSHDSPKSVVFKAVGGRGLSTDALLNKISAACRGKAKLKKLAGISCPGVNENRVRDAYPDASVDILNFW